MLYAQVENGNLNMRQEPNTNAAKLTLIPNGSRIGISNKGNVWSKAIYNQYTGYVMTKFLKFEDEESEQTTDMITITLKRDIAEALYEALKFSLN